MTKLTQYLDSVILGLVDMDKRAGTYPQISRETLHGHLFWETVIPIAIGMPNWGTLQLPAPTPARGRSWTTVTLIDGEVTRAYGEDGTGEYDRCDVCNKVNDILYLDANNECEDCVDAEERDARDPRDLPEDTPSLDTFFHDHEMDID